MPRSTSSIRLTARRSDFMVHDPRVLSLLFEETQQLLLRWTTDFAGFGEDVNQMSVQAIDAVGGLGRQTRAAKQFASDAEALVIRIGQESERLAVDMGTASGAAQDAHEMSEAVAAEARQSVETWQAGLARANDQLDLARAERARARSALESAQAQLRSAESELNSARSSLSSCESSYRTDEQGRRIYNNCSYEQGRVNRAQSEVSRLSSVVAAARERVARAEAEVARCEALVDRCTVGVAQARAITDDAMRTVGDAASAIAYVERGRSEVEAAQEQVALATAVSQALAEIAAEASILQATMESHADELPVFASSLSALASHQGELQASACRLLAELDDQLARFDASFAPDEG